MKKLWLVSSIVLLAAACSHPVATTAPVSTPAGNTQSAMQLIVKTGGRLDWLAKAPSSITYDALSPSGMYDVYVANQDGSSQHCITCSTTALPKGNKGNPEWDPNGQYIVFQAEKAAVTIPTKEAFYTTPGQGFDNDLWLTDSTGTNYWKLVTSAVPAGAILHPHFSADGTKLLWAERLSSGGGHPDGIWALKVGDFAVTNGTPALSNIKSYQPLGQAAVYETHGFSPDGSNIIFTSSVPPATWGNTNIYTLNLATQKVTNLTQDTDVWNEHAHYSHNGKYIIWASSNGNTVKRDAQGGVTGSGNNLDLWIMNADGTNKRRITDIHDPSSAAYEGGGGATADGAWSADDSQYMVYIIRPTTKTQGEIWKLTVPQ